MDTLPWAGVLSLSLQGPLPPGQVPGVLENVISGGMVPLKKKISASLCYFPCTPRGTAVAASAGQDYTFIPSLI